VIYSIGLTGLAGKVGDHVEFTLSVEGNLFIGVNTGDLEKNSGSFQITVLIIPPGTATGLWQTPSNGFTFQGSTIVLSALVFAQNSEIMDVQFTAMVAGQAPLAICESIVHSGDTYTCPWDMRATFRQIHNGAITLGFRIHGSQGQAVENPDGVRTGVARYVISERTRYYAGYAVIDPNDAGVYDQVSARWTVPAAQCAPGEESLSGIWVGITGIPDKSQLAQTGSESDCLTGMPYYQVWWEMYPARSVPLDEPVTAGDTIIASVFFHNNQFRLSLKDLQQGWNFSTTQPGTAADTTTAECIVEAPTLVGPTQQIAQITNFGTVNIACQLSNRQGIGDGSLDYLYQMQTPIANVVTSDLDQTGTFFTVRWKPS
jgi:hypothetical protein